MLSVISSRGNETSVMVSGKTSELINEGAHLIKTLHMTFERDFNRQVADELIVLIGKMAMTDPGSEEGRQLGNDAVELIGKACKEEK